MLRFFIANLAFFLVLGCSSPSRTYDKSALSQNLTKTSIETDNFKLALYSNDLPASEEVNVYISGDGTPWFNGKIPATDPTPRNAITLKLIKHETSLAFILGRPCYHNLEPKHCQSPKIWTSARYSENVLESLNQALSDIIKQHRLTHINLVGYSGGGTLATLLAKKRTDIKHVFTLAANLNLGAWSKRHKLLPLSDSIDPIAITPISIKTTFTHFVGGSDSVVYLEDTQAYQAKFENEALILVEEFDHRCCWVEFWRDFNTNAN